MKRSLGLFCLLFFLNLQASPAKEGMWLPALLRELEKERKFKAVGMRIDAEDIHSLKKSSLADAIVHFGGGCTASLISEKGLILTNHHCGYSQIQDHSSVEDDLLKNGFWSRSLDEELKNPGLEATLIKGIIDVTDEMLRGIPDSLSGKARDQRLEERSRKIVEDSVKGEHLKGKVRSFGEGNAFFLFLTKTYKDLRLVAAPPSSIGKFGGDEDNWMWPRHTGDFSLFRIYAGPDNEPASPSADNVPYEPEKVLPISLGGIDPGDPAMILGFPGSTRQFVPAEYLRYLKDRNFPTRVRIRDAGLKVIENAMRKSDRLRIQYAGKHSSISNYYKKWKGAIEGLERIDAIARRKENEERFLDSAKVQGDQEAIEVFRTMDDAYRAYRKPELARDLFIEFMYYGPDMIRYVRSVNEQFQAYGKAKKNGSLDSLIAAMRKKGERFFKNHSMRVDRALFKAEAPIYRDEVPKKMKPGVFGFVDTAFGGDLAAYADHLYDSSAFLAPDRFQQLIEKIEKKGPEVARDDPALRFVNSLYQGYVFKTRPHYRQAKARVDSLMRLHVADRREMMPGPHWYDANNTLRVSYGRIEGSSPRDGLRYHYATTLEGVMEKADSSKEYFDVPSKLKALYRKGDYGRYGVNGHLPVCFTSSLHTSGGNSGSPVVNAEGYLVGLNFDRSWESVMSDLMYDPERCRNISTDIRYILFLIDRLGNADRLIEEMKIVSTKDRREQYEKWVVEEPDNPKLRVQEARLLLREGRKKEARERIDEAMKLGPYHPAYKVVRAKTYGAEKELRMLEKLVEEQSGHSGSWFALGEARLEQNEKKAAIDAFSRAIALDPDKAEAYRIRAELFHNTGQEGKACRDLRTLKKLDPLAVPRRLAKECP